MIKLEGLQLKMEPLYDEDKVLIFTTMGIHKTGVPMGHNCSIAELFSGDVEDENDSAYQIGRLFMLSPELLGACKNMVAGNVDIGSVERLIAEIENK